MSQWQDDSAVNREATYLTVNIHYIILITAYRSHL